MICILTVLPLKFASFRGHIERRNLFESSLGIGYVGQSTDDHLAPRLKWDTKVTRVVHPKSN